jgi:hypothetical protein
MLSWLQDLVRRKHGMAKIWPVYEGERSTIGEPWAQLPLAEAVALFELRPNDFVSDLDVPPRFGPADRDLTYAGFKHIVVEIERNEGRHGGWKPGFYRSRVTPKDAFNRLVRQALVAELGKDNVVRVNSVTTTDSQSREAIKVTVVISPSAIQKLKEGAALNALVSLQQRLHEMREPRSPIVVYATEAELKQDAGP